MISALLLMQTALAANDPMTNRPERSEASSAVPVPTSQGAAPNNTTGGEPVMRDGFGGNRASAHAQPGMVNAFGNEPFPTVSQQPNRLKQLLRAGTSLGAAALLIEGAVFAITPYDVKLAAGITAVITCAPAIFELLRITHKSCTLSKRRSATANATTTEILPVEPEETA